MSSTKVPWMDFQSTTVRDYTSCLLKSHSKTFTVTLSKFIEDRDAFYDLYPDTLFSLVDDLLQPLPAHKEIILKQNAQYYLYGEMKYETFDTLEQDFSGMFSLKSTIRLNLHTVLENNLNRVMVKNLPTISDSITVYKGLYIKDFDEDGQEGIEEVLMNDYTCCSSSPDGNSDCYIQVRFFIEVLHANEK